MLYARKQWVLLLYGGLSIEGLYLFSPLFLKALYGLFMRYSRFYSIIFLSVEKWNMLHFQSIPEFGVCKIDFNPSYMLMSWQHVKHYSINISLHVWLWPCSLGLFGSFFSPSFLLSVYISVLLLILTLGAVRLTSDLRWCNWWFSVLLNGMLTVGLCVGDWPTFTLLFWRFILEAFCSCDHLIKPPK